MIRFLNGLPLAGFIASVIHEVSASTASAHHHKETAIVWPLFASAILVSMMFALCQTKSTAPWTWQVVHSVVSGLLAMQWVDLFAKYFEPDEDQPFQRLISWLVTYLAVCGFLYMLAASDTKFAAPPRMALAWFVSTVASGFCSALLPDDFVGHGVGVAVLLAEQIVFYAIWITPRVIEMGVRGLNIHGVQLGVPGTLGSPGTGDPIAQWRADCDAISWGAAPFALAGNGLRILKTAITNEPYCHINDRCSWGSPGGGQFWIRTLGTLLLVTAICVHPLSKMKNGAGLKNIVGSVLISTLTTSVAMSFLNFLRFSVSSGLCKNWHLCDEGHDVFLALLVAYVSTVAAMLSAIVMSQLNDVLSTGQWRTILQYCQNSVGTQAGLAWYSVFSAGASSGALDVLNLQGSNLAVLLTVTIGPLYVYYIHPANNRAQDLATAATAAKAAKAVPTSSPPAPQQPAPQQPARAPAARPRASSPPARQQDLHRD